MVRPAPDPVSGLTVADAVADELALAGVDRVFGLPGGEVLHLLDAMRRRGIEFTLCRHEASAGIAAAVYGKLRGTAGVCVTTLGPGASNLLFPIADSLLDREPLVAISAQLPESYPAGHTHQRLPLLEVFGPVTKLAAAVRPGGARSAVRAAVHAAVTEPLGPAYLTLAAEDARADETGAGSSEPPPPQPSPLGRGTVSALTQRLARAERPLVLVGLGSRWANARLIRRWLAAWALPHGVTPKAKGMVDETGPGFVGVFGGMAIDDVMLEALAAADLVVGLGLDPVEIDKTWHATKEIAFVLESPCATGYLPEGALIVSHEAMLEELISDPPPRTWVDAFASQRTKRQEIDEGGRGSLRPTGVVAAVAAGAPPRTVVTTDVGSHKFTFGQFWPSREPAAFWMSNGLSGMGYGLPAAIGAKLARPDLPVLAVMGDGGFAMMSQELETARRAGAPLVAVVLADRSLSLIRIGQENRGLPNYGVDFEPIDSVLVAHATGVDGVRVQDAGELAAAVRAAFAGGRTTVIEVPVDPDSYRGIV
jgi:acetolactate synthase-1/2/3 large subunit